MKQRIFFTFLWSLPTLLLANPTGETVIHGECGFERSANSLMIQQQTDKAIVHWDSFSIAQGEMTQIIQPTELSALLNRVVTDQPSSIYGNLQSNGQVFLLNQNGVVVGPSGVVRTNEFVASALDVSNAEFLRGENLTFKGESTAIVLNQGTIETFKGDIYLIAQHVSNEGFASAPEGTVGLAAGSEILIVPDTLRKMAILVESEGTVSQTGVIEAVQAELIAAGGNSEALAINQGGSIHGTAIIEREGKIFLEAEEGIVSVSGTMTASDGGTIQVLGEYVFLEDEAVLDASGAHGGGEILIGGGFQGENPEIRNADLTSIAPDVTILADSLSSGDGGKVILWGSRACHFWGKASAKGGALSGDGGLIETSSHQDLQYRGTIDLKAPFGKSGTLLLDPSDITIDTGANAGTPLFTTATTNYNPTSATATINNADLSTALGAASVTILTAAGSGAAATTGNVTFNAGANVTWSTPNTLTITSDRQININAVNITSSNSGGTPFTAMNFSATPGATDGHIGILISSNTISTVTGDITMVGTGVGGGFLHGMSIAGSTIIRSTGSGNIGLSGTAGNTAANNDGIRLSASAMIDSQGTGNITLNGTGGNGTNNNLGINIFNSAVVTSSGTGNITINGLGGVTATGTGNTGVAIDNTTFITQTGGATGGGITITAQNGGGTNSCRGVNFFGTATITSQGGDINISNTLGGTTTGTDNGGISVNNTITMQATNNASIILDGRAGAGGGVMVY